MLGKEMGLESGTRPNPTQVRHRSPKRCVRRILQHGMKGIGTLPRKIVLKHLRGRIDGDNGVNVQTSMPGVGERGGKVGRREFAEIADGAVVRHVHSSFGDVAHEIHKGMQVRLDSVSVDLFPAFLVLDAQLVESAQLAFPSRRGHGLEDRSRLVFRKRVRDRVAGIEDSARDDGPVRGALQEGDQHLLAEAGDGHGAELPSGPALGGANPTGGVLFAPPSRSLWNCTLLSRSWTSSISNS